MTEVRQEELNAVVELVEHLPERYRDRAFDLLVSDLIASKRRTEAAGPEPDESKPARKGSSPLPTPVRAFMQRYGITEDHLTKLALIDGREVHFIREPADVGKAEGQAQWALLLALKSALIGEDFKVDPEDVRSVCIAKNFYDRSNFASNFKRNKVNFNSMPEPQGEPVRLSSKGEAELGALIKTLVE